MRGLLIVAVLGHLDRGRWSVAGAGRYNQACVCSSMRPHILATEVFVPCPRSGSLKT